MWLLDARAADLDELALSRWARSQRQPDAETFVTRSHAYPYALVAWSSGPVGIDIERVQVCEPGFLESICTPAERRLEPGGLVDPDAYAIAMWCGKEALSKALGDALAYDPRRLDSPIGWPDGRSGAWPRGRAAGAGRACRLALLALAGRIAAGEARSITAREADRRPPAGPGHLDRAPRM